MDTYDVVVIGAGPAGYVAAIRCAQLGMKTACVDDWMNNGKPSPGGTCLNVGCIPSKALLESSALYEKVAQDMAEHGIKARGVALDLAAMMQRKEAVVGELTSGVQTLLRANGVTLISGRGRLQTDKTVRVVQDKKNKPLLLAAQHIILAPGSSPRAHPAVPCDGKHVVDSSGALAFDAVPETVGVIGAGVIGLELGSVWRRLGSRVTLLKTGKGILPGVDQQVVRIAQQQYKKQGLEFRFDSNVVGSAIKGGKVELHVEQKDGENRLSFDKVIVAVGRTPNTADLFDEQAGIVLDEHGFIQVDGKCRTDVAGVYAVGDVVRGPMLAHKGSEEGVMVAELIAGHHAEVNYDTIPSVIYTHPEVAWCGKGEQELKSSGIDYKTGSFPFAANGRARAGGESAGLIKVLADAESDRVLGVHMVGPHVSELIAQAVIAMEFNASSEDLALTVFAHPSLSETLHEAALDVAGNAIHKARPK